MTTAFAFITFLLGFAHFAIAVAIILTALWVATKLLPSLGEWMNNTDDMTETDYERETRIRNSSTNFDQYV